MKTVFQASYHSRKFDFDAFGMTKDEAVSTLIEGLRLHAVQYNLHPDWWTEGYEGVPTDEIFEMCTFEIGVAYRDREKI